jgi:DNA-binding CsgD family transcriptional regulator
MSTFYSTTQNLSPHELHQGEAVAERYRSAWLTEATTPLVLILTDLSVVWANQMAKQLDQNGLISLESGRLSIRDETTTAGLMSFVTGLAPGPAAWVAGEVEGGHLIVRGEATQPAGWPVGVALTFRITAVPGDYILWADMHDALGLTKAEVAIVKRLLSGDRAEDIAADTPVTLETVRTHIRRIYLKLNVGTREQLFARIMPFRVG